MKTKEEIKQEIERLKNEIQKYKGLLKEDDMRLSIADEIEEDIYILAKEIKKLEWVLGISE